MTEEIYNLWREAWTEEHPGRVPPTFEQWAHIIEMFGFTPSELFNLETDFNDPSDVPE